MGSLTGADFIKRAEKSLNFDEVIFTENELLEFLSDAQRAAVHLRPEVNPVTRVIDLMADSKQSLPEDGYVLFDVIRNIERVADDDDDAPGYAVEGRAVKLRKRGDLDEKPRWHSTSVGAGETREYTYDTRERKVFYVSPPAGTPPHSVEISFSKIPDELTLPIDDIELDDVYEPALLAFMMHRGFMKRAGSQDQANLLLQYANTYLEQFRGFLGQEKTLEERIQPLQFVQLTNQ